MVLGINIMAIGGLLKNKQYDSKENNKESISKAS